MAHRKKKIPVQAPALRDMARRKGHDKVYHRKPDGDPGFPFSTVSPPRDQASFFKSSDAGTSPVDRY